MRIAAVESTPLFTGTAATPHQIIRVTLAGDGDDLPSAPVLVRVEGPGVTTPQALRIEGPAAGTERTAEVPVAIAAPHRPGSTLPATVIAEILVAGTGQTRAAQDAVITVAEPGWTMWMVSHFHYDPVWWDTQGQYTQSRLLPPGEDGRLPDVRTAFELVSLHLDAARTDPDYKFVLAEIDYLKPYFDAHPADRADLRKFLADGRIEIVGGNYNEPNTNLTSAESTIRNAIYGLGHQRDVLGGDPSTAWMLDVFGHDPGYPGLMAGAGLTESAWARGPYHQWGPHRTVGGNERMQFASEFEWVSPDGGGLLTSYMANHYGAGWGTHQAADLAGAEADALGQFLSLAPVAATRNVLLPVGADHVIPSRWVTAIHRDWNARYTWPRFVTALPREFFAAVRADAADRGIWLTPQTRDMNPVYPGKDVSYIDTKQAQRAAEVAAMDGERLATLAWLAGAGYPAESIDKAWRLLVFGAHHDAITGTESDQVYLDLLGGWREAFERGDTARRDAAAYLAGLADTRHPAQQPGQHPWPVVVFSTLSWPRPGLATVTLTFDAPGPPWLTLRDETGREAGFLAEGVRRHAGGGLAAVTLTFLAQPPALGYRTYWAGPAPGPGQEGWARHPGTAIGNSVFTAGADPARGGALTRLTDRRSGRELLRGPGNELLLQEEYGSHPRWGEGPWLLSPKGPGTGSAAGHAQVRAERCAIGSRLVSEFPLGGLRVTQQTLLWDGLDRVEFRTDVDGSIGADHLLRVRFPVSVPGGLPLCQTATAVVGRPFGAADADVAQCPFTLDNPAHEWFGLGSTARVAAGGQAWAIGVAEVILPAPGPHRGDWQSATRDFVVKLASQGVTATCSQPDGPRYGAIDLDSNLPDCRIALGGPDHNPWTRRLLAGLPPRAQAEAAALLAGGRPARLWLPATRLRAEVFGPGADVRGERDLPVLIVAGEDLAAAIRAAAGDLACPVVSADLIGADLAGDRPAGDGPARDSLLAGHTVALLNRGTPSFLVTPDGTLHLTLMRACSTWPSGVWIDGERRTAPDGSSFAWQHWSHTFEYALVAGGDWRDAGFTLAGQEYNHGLLAWPATPHPGPLPGQASLAGVETPASARPTAMLTALKPQGNPLASGRPGEPGRADGVTVRLRDTGVPGPEPARVRLFVPVTAANLSSIREDDGGPAVPLAGGAASVRVPPASTVTLVLATGGGMLTDAPAVPGRQPPPEPAQPVFTRYWLHGKGPAPAGNLPVAVHLAPDRIALATAAPDVGPASARLQLTVAAGLEPAAGQVILDVPAGLMVEGPDGTPPGPVPYRLASSEHGCWDLAVRALPGAGPGRYFVAARIQDQLGQTLEDAVLITVGEPPPPSRDQPLPDLLPRLEADQQAQAGEISVRMIAPNAPLRPGERGEITVQIANRTAGTIRGESQLVSPFGTWEVIGPWTLGFHARQAEVATLRYPVEVPAYARPGSRWWALAKVMYFGRVCYSECLPVTVAE